ncbi:MAG: DUF3883 domain-containing protein, partial [Paludibacteraceae bacterium]|nr:DUF3883 domain-containing protein [Paludibacteraceae bacterium]
QKMVKRLFSDEIVPSLNFSEPIGLRTFLSVVGSPIIISSLDMGLNSMSDFNKKIDGLPWPNGGAPLAKTVNKSVSDFENIDADDKIVVLVTGGSDNFRYEMGDVAYEINKAEGKVRLVVLGINLSENDEKDAISSIEKCNGAFCNIKMNDDNYERFEAKAQLETFFNALKGKPAAPKVQEPAKNIVKETPKVEPVKIEFSAPTITVSEKKTAAEPQFESIKPIEVKPAEIPNESESADEIDVFDVLAKNNEAIKACLLNNVEAFNLLSARLDSANAKIDKLIADDKAVVIEEDSELNAEIADKSRAIVMQLLQSKYPERVKSVNNTEKGYDFQVWLDNESVEYRIACKGLLDEQQTFCMARKEWEVCMKNNRNYQVYLINNMSSQPTVTIIDNLMGWLLKGKIVPCAPKNMKIKADTVTLTIVK